jgi:hypothetical protein
LFLETPSFASPFALTLDGDRLLIVRLENGERADVNLFEGTNLRGDPCVIAGNAKHAYVLVCDTSTIIRVDLETAERVEAIHVPCCASTIAVDAEDKMLVIGVAEITESNLFIYDLDQKTFSESPPIIGRPVATFADGSRFGTLSLVGPSSSSQTFLTVSEGTTLKAEYEIGGEHRSFVYVGASRETSERHSGSGGCTVEPRSGSSFWCLLIGFGFAVGRLARS